MTAVIGRYAPSPTGALHLGNLRTALAAYCSALSQGGHFLLRVEDLDRPRVVEGSEALQIADLRALGIEWEPQVLRQSERDAVYEDAFEGLRRNGYVYPCFCSRRDIREALSAPHVEDRGPNAYPGTCESLSDDEAQSRIAVGEQHSWRLRVAGAPRLFEDRFAGRCEIDLWQEGGDFVIRRADGLYAYQLACAVDDALSAVTEVVRGADLLVSGARQAYLIQCLGHPVPAYAHIPLMLGEDGRRLSKRFGAEDLRHFFGQGFDGEAIRSYLAFTLGILELGERASMEDISRRFDTKKIPRTNIGFIPGELEMFRKRIQY
ncbi:MAG: tRNA glutamyl-Q(34) synthetase GluQRS [Sumerlaeia bacterium]